jgi:hypothetical protein
MLRFTLFDRNDLHSVFAPNKIAALDEIEKYEAGTLLNTSPDDLYVYLTAKHAVEPLTLDKGGITAYHEETRTPSQYDLGFAYGRPDANGRPAVKVMYSIPFAGDPSLFFVLPPSFNAAYPAPPHGRVRAEQGVLEVGYVRSHGRRDDERAVAGRAAEIEAEFERDLAQIERRVEALRPAVDERNKDLATAIRECVTERRKRLLNNQGLAAALRYPLKQRGDAAAQTFAVPAVRKRLLLPPPASSEPYQPEPTIEMRAYESVLSTISNLSIAMERSPTTFRHMGEENIRDLILVILNTVYEGHRATGETFNYGGKTDILIRGDDGMNLFVGECKVWKGEKALLEALGQLLGYVTWRDTKAALLVFNRNSGFSNVLETIREAVPKHPNFKRTDSYGGQTGFRFVLHRPDDPNREVILTVLGFDVPTG